MIVNRGINKIHREYIIIYLKRFTEEGHTPIAWICRLTADSERIGFFQVYPIGLTLGQ